MFKIIALEINRPPDLVGFVVKPLLEMSGDEIKLMERQSRRESITKVLKPSTYMFYDGYKKENGFYVRKADCLADDFFCNQSDECPSVSISAIVGENGSGKSSLIAYLVRMMNNLACKCGKSINGYKEGDLLFVDELYGTMYGEVDGDYFRIRQDNNVMSVKFKNDDAEIAIGEQCSKERLRHILKQMFYTIVIDYSAYDWNIYDYRSEWCETSEIDEMITDNDKCWIGKLFHKNDSYQTPMVLNPFRSYGQIDYRNEQNLLTDRLLLLIIKEQENVDNLLLQKHPELLTFDAMDEHSLPANRKFPSFKLLQILVDVGVVRNRWKYNKEHVNRLCESILECWSECYGIRFNDMLTDERDDDDVKRVMNYIVYKTIKVSTVYSQYHRFSSIFKSEEDIEYIKKYVNLLYEDETHITLKLRKAFAFLLFRHYGTNMGRRVNGTIIHEVAIEDFNEKIKGTKKQQQQIVTKLMAKYAFENRPEQLHTWKEEELLPAPCFKTDILMKEPNSPANAYLRYSMMSSGEKHIINGMCTFVYHLYNLDSAFNTDDVNRLKYKNVNIIFDELELYYHPQSQIMLVKNILNTIKGMRLRNIKNINIIMSTHSPFILSDIPVSNTVKISNGECDNTKENNFCANVYDILNSHFFMDVFIGNFAKRKLEEIFVEVNDFCENGNVDNMDKVRRDVMLIGDDVIRLSLLERMGQKSERMEKEAELERIRQRMQELENELSPYEQ